MLRDVKYFINILKEDKMLYDIFMYIGNYSTKYLEEFNYFEVNQVNLKELISCIKTDIVKKSDSIIQKYIDKLISYGLCKYVIENDKNFLLGENHNDASDDERLKYYKDLGYPKHNTDIALTQGIHECCGINIFKTICRAIRAEEADKNLKEALEASINEITKPYDEKIEKLAKDLENKMNEVNHNLDSGVIKNIQVISIFAGIISLLFANIMGIKEFATIGIKGVLILNSSMVMSIFALILFSKILIVGGKISFKNIIYCFIIISFTIIPAILYLCNIIK